MKRYRYLLCLFVSFLLLFAVGRLIFMLYNFPLVIAGIAPDGQICLSDLWQAWTHGLGMDISTTGYLVAIPWLCCLVAIFWRRMPLRAILVPYLVVILALLWIIILGDTYLYEFWKFKINATVFAYMHNPEGATSSVSLWFLVSRVGSILVLIGLTVWLFIRLTPRRLPDTRHFIVETIAMVLVGGFIFLGIRGGVKASTMNVGQAYYSERLYLNHSAVNPAFSLLFSMLKSQKYSDQFDYFSEQERAEVFQGLYPEETEDVADTLLNVKRPNVLVVLMESFGSKFIQELGGIPGVAPNMSRLIPQGIFWDNYYSNSFRTDRGTVSAFSGWVSYPTASLMQLPDKQNHLPSLANTLLRAGYFTEFLYGGDIKFVGQRGYLINTGYRQLVSDVDFPLAETTESKWGVNDGLTADRALQLVREMPADKPWHLVYQTLSSHEPFEVPYHRLEDEKLNAFAYTDSCVGALVDSLQALPLWKDMLVILMPDHGFLYDLTFQDPAFFHCPMLWLGGAIRQPRRIHTLMNQSDFAATLLSQMGLKHQNFPWSRNVCSRNYTYPFAYSTFPSGILFADSTGVTVFDITSKLPITQQPTPNPNRIRRAKAILQTSYDRLDSLK